jgi:hypothetical protein
MEILPMPWANRERAREARAARLEHMEEQIATGALVVRHMTTSERAAWKRERNRRDALMTPTERARSAAILRERRRRADFSARESD